MEGGKDRKVAGRRVATAIKAPAMFSRHMPPRGIKRLYRERMKRGKAVQRQCYRGLLSLHEGARMRYQD